MMRELLQNLSIFFWKVVAVLLRWLDFVLRVLIVEVRLNDSSLAMDDCLTSDDVSFGSYSSILCRLLFWYALSCSKNKVPRESTKLTVLLLA